jgi:hypothetical protein
VGFLECDQQTLEDELRTRGGEERLIDGLVLLLVLGLQVLWLLGSAPLPAWLGRPALDWHTCYLAEHGTN